MIWRKRQRDETMRNANSRHDKVSDIHTHTDTLTHIHTSSLSVIHTNQWCWSVFLTRLVTELAWRVHVHCSETVSADCEIHVCVCVCVCDQHMWSVWSLIRHSTTWTTRPVRSWWTQWTRVTSSYDLAARSVGQKVSRSVSQSLLLLRWWKLWHEQLSVVCVCVCVCVACCVCLSACWYVCLHL